MLHLLHVFVIASRRQRAIRLFRLSHHVNMDRFGNPNSLVGIVFLYYCVSRLLCFHLRTQAMSHAWLSVFVYRSLDTGLIPPTTRV